jgi:hypothetical protein
MRAFWRTLVAIARELADENAYMRHLKAHGVEHSPDEWRRFQEHRLNAKFVRPKCC